MTPRDDVARYLTNAEICLKEVTQIIAHGTMSQEQRHKADITLEAAILELTQAQDWLRDRQGK